MKSFLLNHKVRFQLFLDLRWIRFHWIYICPHSSNQIPLYIKVRSNPLRLVGPDVRVHPLGVVQDHDVLDQDALNALEINIYSTFDSTLIDTTLYEGEKQSTKLFDHQSQLLRTIYNIPQRIIRDVLQNFIR